MPAVGGQNSSLDVDSFLGSLRIGFVIASVVKKLLCIGGRGSSVVVMTSYVVVESDVSIGSWVSGVLVMMSFVGGETDVLARNRMPALAFLVHCLYPFNVKNK